MEGRRRVRDIYVDDGSTDGTAAELATCCDPILAAVRAPQASGGQSSAGADRGAGGAGAHHRHDGRRRAERPRLLPALLAAMEAGGPRIGMVAGQRLGRKDTGFKRWQSRIANQVRAFILKDGRRDTGCGLKAIRREVYHRRCPISMPCIGSCRPSSGARAMTWPMSTWSTVPALSGTVQLWILRSALGRHSRPRRRMVADPPSPAASRSSLERRPMLAEIARATGDYLHDVFVNQLDWWIVLGFVAQILFTMRFVVQWIASEKAGKSVIPFSFWTFSIGGGALLLLYALVRRDPVYILGQGLSLLIYFRNVSFVMERREACRREGRAAGLSC